MRDVRPLARVGALGEEPAELVELAGGARRIPCAWWSTSAIALSTSRSGPAARMPRPPRSRPSHSERRTARYDSASTAPSAPISTSSAASASSASSCVAGRRTIPRARALVLGDRRRVDLDRLGRLEPALEPVEPGGDQAAEREVRVAARVARLQLGVRRRLLGARGTATATRTGASRLSWPQQANAPAQYCGTMRWYELKLGAVSPQRPGQVLEHAGDERAASSESPSARPRRGSGCARRPRARSGRGRRCRRSRATASARARRRGRAARRRRGSSRARAAARPRPAAPARAPVEISCWPWPSSA